MAGTDLLVIGGGVVGLAVAWQAAAQGAAVLVADSGEDGAASWAGAGMLAPVSELEFGEEHLLRLGLAAVARYPSFVRALEADSGLPVGLRDEGSLLVAFDADDRAALQRLRRHRAALGLPASELTGAAARELEPLLSARATAAVLTAGDLSIDNRRLIRALRAAGGRRGVRFVAQAVTEILAGPAVRLADGQLQRGDAVVLAAGCWSGHLLPGLPVRPVLGEILRLRVPAELDRLGGGLTRTVRGLVRGRRVYLVPRQDGEVVVGATVRERGFDPRVSAGAVLELLQDAAELVPAVAELEFAEARAGLRPGTPDNGPLLGRAGPAGVVVATGHHRSGFLLAPITADAVLALLAGDDPGPHWAAFGPDRFQADRFQENRFQENRFQRRRSPDG